MSFYEIGKATVAATTGSAYATCHGLTTLLPEIVEVGFFCNAATASSVEIARPANTPAASTSTLFTALDPDAQPASQVNFDTAWGTAPTTPTAIFRLVTLPAVIGAGYVAVWQLGTGIKLAKTAGSGQWMVLWNFGAGTGSVLNAYVREDE